LAKVDYTEMGAVTISVATTDRTKKKIKWKKFNWAFAYRQQSKYIRLDKPKPLCNILYEKLGKKNVYKNCMSSFQSRLFADNVYRKFQLIDDFSLRLEDILRNASMKF
jgi:hypothetical protein